VAAPREPARIPSGALRRRQAGVGGLEAGSQANTPGRGEPSRRSAQLGAAGDAAVGVQGPLAADRAAGDAGGAELAEGADDDVLQ